MHAGNASGSSGSRHPCRRHRHLYRAVLPRCCRRRYAPPGRCAHPVCAGGHGEYGAVGAAPVAGAVERVGGCQSGAFSRSLCFRNGDEHGCRGGWVHAGACAPSRGSALCFGWRRHLGRLTADVAGARRRGHRDRRSAVSRRARCDSSQCTCRCLRSVGRTGFRPRVERRCPRRLRCAPAPCESEHAASTLACHCRHLPPRAADRRCGLTAHSPAGAMAAPSSDGC